MATGTIKNSNLLSNILTRTVTVQISYLAAVTGSGSADATLSNYDIVGIVGITLANPTTNNLTSADITNNTITVYLNRTNGQTFEGSSTADVTILYAKR